MELALQPIHWLGSFVLQMAAFGHTRDSRQRVHRSDLN